jgi:hypothetical protein
MLRIPSEVQAQFRKAQAGASGLLAVERLWAGRTPALDIL